jgi:hypothetical protein
MNLLEVIKMKDKEEKVKNIEVIKDRYRILYYFQSPHKDFRVEERKEITQKSTGNKRMEWVFCGWFYNMKSAIEYIIKSGCLEDEEISNLEEYVKMQEKMIEEIKNMDLEVLKGAI